MEYSTWTSLFEVADSASVTAPTGEDTTSAIALRITISFASEYWTETRVSRMNPSTTGLLIVGNAVIDVGTAAGIVAVGDIVGYIYFEGDAVGGDVSVGSNVMIYGAEDGKGNPNSACVGEISSIWTGMRLGLGLGDGLEDGEDFDASVERDEGSVVDGVVGSTVELSRAALVGDGVSVGTDVGPQSPQATGQARLATTSLSPTSEQRRAGLSATHAHEVVFWYHTCQLALSAQTSGAKVGEGNGWSEGSREGFEEGQVD